MIPRAYQLAAEDAPVKKIGKATDHTGVRFGLWTALSLLPSNGRQTRWLCKCDCGNEGVVPADALVKGKSRSCGCMSNTWRTIIKHGHTSGKGKPSGTYSSWHAMRQRCENENIGQFADYGGRGIKVCERWSDFRLFLEDMGERPEGMTLDRVDPNGNYEPSNCAWATRKQQSANQRVKIRNGDIISLTSAIECLLTADNDNITDAIAVLRQAYAEFQARGAA